jgi:hypothetical protein
MVGSGLTDTGKMGPMDTYGFQDIGQILTDPIAILPLPIEMAEAMLLTTYAMLAIGDTIPASMFRAIDVMILTIIIPEDTMTPIAAIM